MGGARLYKAGTPYNATDLADLDYVQSADVVYFAHINYPPQKITRFGHTNWTFDPVAFGPTVAAPTGLAALVSDSNKDTTLSNGDPNQNSQWYPLEKTYAVATVGINGQVSRLSAGSSATNDLSLKGNYNSLSWNADPAADYYLIFAHDNNSLSYGYLGRAKANSFIDGDGGVAPDYADGPRVGDNPFGVAGDYPSTVTFHQQRLFWGRTANKPNGIWGSQSADFENMDKSVPTKADDAFTVALVSDRVNAVAQLASLKSLLALTSDGIFSVSGGEGAALTATQIQSERQIGRGSSRLNPLVIDSVLFFRPSQGSSVRTLGYTFEVDGYRSNDVTIFSPHFFDGYSIVSWAFQQEPYACIWAVRDDGKLLCLTWEQEQQVWGWTMCEFDGLVEQVAVITEYGMDRVYLAVRRTLAGKEDVFIERMALPLLVAEDLVDCCYLDCAVTQKKDEATKTITGLWHLEGEAVMAFADGYVVEDLVVAGGKLTLEFPAKTITVGKPYTGEIETLPLSLSSDQGSRHTDRQMIESATVRVDKTRGISVGVRDGDLFELKQREFEELDNPIALKTGDFDVNLSAKWKDGATLRVVQDYPLPATISALFIKPTVTS